MSKRAMLTAAAAAMIAAASLAATAGGAFAASTPTHHKPLICIFLPSLSVCGESMAMAMPAHKTTIVTNKPMMSKPMMAPKKY